MARRFPGPPGCCVPPVADFVGHHGEPAVLAGAGGLDGGVECQEIGLSGDFADDLDDLADLMWTWRICSIASIDCLTALPPSSASRLASLPTPRPSRRFPSRLRWSACELFDARRHLLGAGALFLCRLGEGLGAFRDGPGPFGRLARVFGHVADDVRRPYNIVRMPAASSSIGSSPATSTVAVRIARGR